jgi:hypothetical protein
MRAYMSNLHGRKHQDIYGQGAFFDLNLTGRQADMLKEMVPNTECVVASYGDAKRSMVVFAMYLFEREAICPTEGPGDSCRVFFGRLRKEVRLPKRDAANIPEYAPFFNKNGGFKRPSAYYSES